jgi:type III secretion protein V
VLGHPNALMMSGAIVATFLVVPGLPKWLFLCLALILITAGYFGRAERGRSGSFEPAAMPAMRRDGSHLMSASPEEHAAPIAIPLRVRLAPDLRAALSPPAFDTALERQKTQLCEELGLPFPGLKVIFDAKLATGRYAIDVQEMQVSQGDLANSKVVTLAPHDSAAGAAETARVGAAPQASAQAAASERPAARSSLEETLAAHIAWVARQHADAFVGMQEVHTLLSRAASQLPDLAAEMQRVVPLQRVAEVLRRLVQEGVSIRYLRESARACCLGGRAKKTS